MNQQLLNKINEVTYSAHNQVDHEISKLNKVCKEGCNACCHQIVEVFTWEEPRIFDFIYRNFNAKKKKELSKNIKQWFKYFNKNTKEASRDNPLNFLDISEIQHIFREKKIACPFLMKSSCSIYEARPMICRAHYQKDSAENCKTDPHLTTPVDAQKIFHTATSGFDPEVFPRATKPLAYLVAEEFSEDIKSKPLTGLIYDPNNMFNRI